MFSTKISAQQFKAKENSFQFKNIDAHCLFFVTSTTNYLSIYSNSSLCLQATVSRDKYLRSLYLKISELPVHIFLPLTDIRKGFAVKTDVSIRDVTIMSQSEICRPLNNIVPIRLTICWTVGFFCGFNTKANTLQLTAFAFIHTRCHYYSSSQ